MPALRWRPVRQRVLKFILDRRLLAAGDRLGLAVSGGADSVALLPVLVELQPARDAAAHPLPVLHVTAVRLDSGWVRINATAAGDALSLNATAGRLSHHFTVQEARELSSAPRLAE